MLGKRKSASSPMSLGSSGRKELKRILSKPQTKTEKEIIRKSEATYRHYSEKWQQR